MLKNNLCYLKAISIVLLLLFSTISKAHTTPIETQLTHYLTTHQQAQFLLLKKLVNINSGTMNVAGVERVGNLLRPQFEQLGFKVHWVKEPANMHRAATLVAEHPGHRGKRILLIGHLDTVFPAHSSFQHVKRHGNTATGPGIVDDKGGDVVILYALKALYAANALHDANITVVLTGDEEDSGKPAAISRKPLLAAAQQSDIALDFELAISLDTAIIARRGITDWMIQTAGNQAHSSGIFQKEAGFGAIYELSRILDTMRNELAHEHYLTFSPGLILGGTIIDFDKKNSRGSAFGKENVMAKTALARGDLRYLSVAQKINAQKKMTAIVATHLAGTQASISFKDGIPAMPPTAANLELLKKYSHVSMALGQGAVNYIDPGSRGAGDISYVASIVSASLGGLGPVGTGAHSDNETLDISSLPIQTQRTALLIYRLTYGKIS